MPDDGAGPSALPDLLVIGDSHSNALVEGCEAHGLTVAMLRFSGNFWHAGRIALHPVHGLSARGLTGANRQVASLRARLGTVAVLGNHDHWRDAAAMRTALRAGGISVLANTAIRRGPLLIFGADDPFTRHEDIAALEKAGSRHPGAAVMLSDSPDIAPQLTSRFPLIFAGIRIAGRSRCRSSARSQPFRDMATAMLAG